MSKQYKEAPIYEKKLNSVMSRLGVSTFDYNWDRHSCWVEFTYEGQFYRFEHSVENAKSNGSNIVYGSDAFAQLVLTLEDIARMTERNIYKLSTLISGFKALPEPPKIPDCFKLLGFSRIPDIQELKERYRAIAKIAHPDVGGDSDYFISIENAYKSAKEYLDAENN